MATAQTYEFGPYRLDVPKCRLLRQGEPVALTGKAFDILLALIERRDRVVDKAELMQLVWPDSFVEEANLTQHIFVLRKILGEDASGSHYIETVPRRGYRFAAEIREATPAPIPAAAATPTPTSESVAGMTGVNRNTRTVAIAAALAVALAIGAFAAWRVSKQPTGESNPLPTIAVLPFKVINPEPTDEHLGLGMTDALITRLGNVRRIIVRPSSAVWQYAAGSADPARAARELRVSTVVDGTVQKSGDRIRVTVQLVDIGAAAALWSQTFDERFTDIFAVQDSISRQVAEALVPNLTGGERNRIGRSYTNSIAAYQLYVRGRYHWNRRSDADLLKSIELFQQAIREDAGYAMSRSVCTWRRSRRWRNPPPGRLDPERWARSVTRTRPPAGRLMRGESSRR